jgi:DNA polymerase-3 subunit beta
MQIKVAREQMMPSLMKVSGVVEKRQTLPILGNLLVSADEEGITVTGTDLEVEVASRCFASVYQSGEITVPARKFIDIFRTLPEGSEIEVRVENERVMLRAGRSRFVLSTLAAKGFPLMDVAASDQRLEFPQRILKGLLERTAFAMANQDVRYYLNGLLMAVRQGRILTVATDGHRLAKVEANFEVDTVAAEAELIVPRKTVMELGRLLGAVEDPCQMEFSDRALRVAAGDTVLTSKLIDGRYPDYEKVIPRGAQKRAVVDKELLRQALTRTSILSNEKYKGVSLSFGANELRCLAHNPELEEAEEQLAVDYAEEKTVIGFNVAYLLDVLSALDTSEIEISFTDSNSSAVLRRPGGGEEEAYVVMPMRL